MALTDYVIMPGQDYQDACDSIRAKTGKTDLIKSGEMATEIGSISGGGGMDVVKIIDGTIESIESDEVTVVRQQGFSGCSQLATVSFPNATTLGVSCFVSTYALQHIFLPKVTSISGNAFDNSRIPVIVLPSLTSAKGASYAFRNNNKLQSIDVGNVDGFGLNAFQNDSILTTIVIRATRVVSLTNSSLNGTSFASGGSGGTIYIPKVLYDHLGDGSSLDYKAATNWSTLDGYGTITWAQIEGSIYETQYADGTPIPTT